MSFEIGKKYVGSTDGRVEPVVYECVYKDKDGIVLKGPSGGLGAYEYKNYGALYGYFVEYKEPRFLTRWINVWEKPDGSIVLGGSNYHNKEDGERLANHNNHLSWKLLDTIEVKWVEKV